jgi:hypothetical protein
MDSCSDLRKVLESCRDFEAIMSAMRWAGVVGFVRQKVMVRLSSPKYAVKVIASPVEEARKAVIEASRPFARHADDSADESADCHYCVVGKPRPECLLFIALARLAALEQEKKP